MAELADGLVDDICNFVAGRAASNLITEAAGNRYCRLYTVMPGTDGTGGTTPAGGAYAATRCDTAYTDAAAGGTIDNATSIIFPTATDSWGTIVGCAIWSAASGGSYYGQTTFGSSTAVDNGDTFYIPAGDLDITIT